ncbi:MAG: tRNA pseudouridine(55) synthase TruB [Burkholderiales bacterium]|nr:tRNA pseudouridine(55) synthase TruB [Burkholderiales bacterium]
MQRRRRVDGVLLLDKPSGITSQAAVTKVKRLFLAEKAGHTGTLDPMASGLLPVCLGEATKFAQFALNSDKTYAATIRLGMTTATGDLEGAVTATAAVTVGRDEIEAVLRRFKGEITQVPPMYSALKHGGQPLYKYARAGQEVPRESRRVHIISLEIVDFSRDELRIMVTCSKGTYIRVLAEDIGSALGCGGCLAALRRIATGPFRLGESSHTPEALEAISPDTRETLLLPVDSMGAMLPRVDLDRHQARLLTTGRVLNAATGVASGLVRIYGPDQDFLGIAEIRPPGQIVAHRLLAQQVLLEKTGG